jgi:preprotein translocase subunit SecE
VAEWSIAAVLKTAKAKHLRGFESLPLRQIVNVKKYILGLLTAFLALTAIVAAPGDAPQTPAAPAGPAQVAATDPVTPGVTTPAAATATPASTTTTPAAPSPASRRTTETSFLSLGIWAAVILAVFFFLWSKGYLVKIRNYFAETEEELKKCSWPSRDELKGSTVVILVTTILLGAFTVVVDWVLSNLMRLIT